MTRRYLISATDCHSQEGRRNRGSFGACVLRSEQLFQIALQIGSSSALLRRVKCVHRRAIVIPEFIYVLSRRSVEAKNERIGIAGNVLRGNSGGAESFNNVTLNSPGHRADETLRRWRR